MMEKVMKRAARRAQQERIWNKRLKQEFNWNWKGCESWVDMKQHKCYYVLKTTGKPCSCYGCAGPSYRRLFYKFDTDRLIREGLYDDISHQTPHGKNQKIVDWD